MDNRTQFVIAGLPACHWEHIQHPLLLLLHPQRPSTDPLGHTASESCQHSSEHAHLCEHSSLLNSLMISYWSYIRSLNREHCNLQHYMLAIVWPLDNGISTFDSRWQTGWDLWGNIRLTRDNNLGRPKLWSFTGAHVLANPFRPEVITLHIQRALEKLMPDSFFCSKHSYLREIS